MLVISSFCRHCVVDTGENIATPLILGPKKLLCNTLTPSPMLLDWPTANVVRISTIHRQTDLTSTRTLMPHAVILLSHVLFSR